MIPERARAFYQKLKAADKAALDAFYVQYPEFAKDPMLKSLQQKVVNSLSESEFVAWAGKDFHLDNMPVIKLKPEEMQALSGGTYTTILDLSGDNIGRGSIAAVTTDKKKTTLA